jgi:L-ascorbate metabolism protein UlaG (beta-lactamase superfamily)
MPFAPTSYIPITSQSDRPMHLTYYGANSWLLDLADQRILIDPWLVETLTFNGQSWLFEGRHAVAPQQPEGVTLILLSQGLDDHAHIPTLKILDKSIPVVGSASAVKRVRELGYSDVTLLKPGDRHQLGDLTIEATPGAPVPQVENGYVLRGEGRSLYYEPHGYSPKDLVGPIDIVITPIVDLGLPIVGPIIKGNDLTVDLAQRLQAKYVLPTAAGGDISYSGILDRLLQVTGDAAIFEGLLRSRQSDTTLLVPTVGEPIELLG